jgi:cardiolipin synthase
MSDTFQVDGNQLALLQNGAAYFPRLCADIDAARSFVFLESYIFAADETALRVSHALQRAARRGVTVRVLLDGFGSAGLPQRWLDELQSAGVQVHFFRRELYRFKMRRHRLRRLHRKLVVLDGEVAYIGGINIIADETGNSGAPRFDFAVRLEGHLAGEIHAVMRRLWVAVLWARGRRMERLVASRRKAEPTAGPNAELLLRDNLRHRRDIERAYLRAIGGAQREIVIANAYFLPGRIFRRALMLAARRGVRVVLLLQGRVEHRLLHYATHALYRQLLTAGVEIYEYQTAFLHAKVAVVDMQWATVGSSNIDPFSLMLAREANLAVRDADFAQALRDRLFLAIAQDAVRIRPERWSDMNWAARLTARLSYAAVRMAIGVLGYGKRVV